MGDSQRLTPADQLRFAREQYESAQDLTVAVEEEFAVLDPETLGLSNRFEELQAAAQGTALEEHLVGELIASEVEVRTGRCDTFAECVATDTWPGYATDVELIGLPLWLEAQYEEEMVL